MSLQFPMASNSYMPQQITAYAMPTINSIMAGQPCVQTYTAAPMGYGGYQQSASNNGGFGQVVGLLSSVVGLLGQVVNSLGMGGGGGGCYPQQGGYPPINTGYMQQSGWPSNGGSSWQPGGCMPPPVHFQYDTGGCGCPSPQQYPPQGGYPTQYPPYPQPNPGPYPAPEPHGLGLIIDDEDPFNGGDDPFGNDDDPFNGGDDSFGNDDDPFDNGNDPFGEENVDETNNTNTSDLEVITDTATRNSYSFNGSRKNYEITGNLGDNKFDVRNLDNSDLKINSFDDGDTLRLEADSLDDITFETIYSATNNTIKLEDSNGNVITLTIPDDKDEDWLKERLLGADGQNLTTGSGGGSTEDLRVVQDTAAKNLYNYSGDEKNYRIEGNEGDNTFDMRQLTNSNFEIKEFDDDDIIRLNETSIEDVEIEHNSGQTYTIFDSDGNAIKVTIPAGEDMEWLQRHLTGSNGQPLVTGGVSALPDWLPTNYTGTYFTENPTEERGYRQFGSEHGPEANLSNTIIDFDVWRGRGGDNRDNYSLSGDQNIFTANIRKDAGSFTYNVSATNSRLNLEIGNDDWIAISGYSASNLTTVRNSAGNPIITSEGADKVSVQFFDKNTGSIYKIIMAGSVNDATIVSKIRGRFKAA